MRERLEALVHRDGTAVSGTRESPAPAVAVTNAGGQPATSATFSVCMLAHNSERTIGDALGRVRPYVREAIVLDLGSVDRSREVAMEYQARLYGGQFLDDLGSLRNALMSRATSDWILLLDADEVLPDRHVQKLLELLEALPADVLGVRFAVHDVHGAGDGCGADFETRLVRNRSEISYDRRGCGGLERSIAHIGGRLVDSDIELARAAKVTRCRTAGPRCFCPCCTPTWPRTRAIRWCCWIWAGSTSTWAITFTPSAI